MVGVGMLPLPMIQHWRPGTAGVPGVVVTAAEVAVVGAGGEPGVQHRGTHAGAHHHLSGAGRFDSGAVGSDATVY